MTASNTLLATEHLDIGYIRRRGPARKVANDLSLNLRKGEIVCLVGPNGIGKSTLVRTLSGLQPSLGGTVTVSGRPLASYSSAELARKMSLVLTERISSHSMSAFELASLGRYPHTDWRGRLGRKDREIVERALKTVGASHLTARHIDELSDGERQKVMIARALAQQTDIILLDEPTAFLDPPHRVEILKILRERAWEERCAILISIHDIDLAMRFSDRMWIFTPERKIECGTPEDLALAGTVKKAFSIDGIDFDPLSRKWIFYRPNKGRIGLGGEGTVMAWTARALERSGYEISSRGTACDAQISVAKKGSRDVWFSDVRGEIRRHESIHELLVRLGEKVLPAETEDRQ